MLFGLNNYLHLHTGNGIPLAIKYLALMMKQVISVHIKFIKWMNVWNDYTGLQPDTHFYWLKLEEKSFGGI